jgi:hypothetical protein
MPPMSQPEGGRVCIDCRYDMTDVPAGSPCPECGGHDVAFCNAEELDLRAFGKRALLLAGPSLVTLAAIFGLTAVFGEQAPEPLFAIAAAGISAIYLCWYLALRLPSPCVGAHRPHTALDRAALWGTLTIICLFLVRCAF